ncbi:MAG: PorP/SprF family type IX secretion system membrane protein [Saprospiraceae bacterium]
MILVLQKIKKTVSILVFIFSFSRIFTQDLHYSQFYNQPQSYNPAQVGVFAGDHRIIASLRDQWRFVPVPWFTLSGSYDRRFDIGREGKQFFGAGAILHYDRQGDSKLQLASLNLSGSYHYVLHRNHIIGAGILLGLSSRGFNNNDLTWDKQWNGDSFDPNSPSGESFDAQTVTFLENAVGVQYRLQKSSRTFLELGGSVFHLINPSANFYNPDITKLPRHFTLSALGNLKIVDKLDIQLHGLQQMQGEYEELVFGGLVKYYLSNKPGKVFHIHAGLGYRTAKSFFPTIAMQYNEIYASFSFDVDNNEFNRILNSNRGGPEFHVRYIITNVKPMYEHKACPIY